MAVVSTNYVPLNSDQYEQTPEEQQAAYEEATANLQNTLLTDGIDLSGLSDLGSMDLFSPNAMRDEWDSNPDHYMNSEYWRAGSGMDNAENAGYMGHYYIGEDGNRYRKVVTYDRERDAMKEEYTDERMYRWSPSDEHKRTHRDEGAANAAYGKEFNGGTGAGWYTEAEIKAAWDAGDMRQMQDQGVSWDQYWGYVTGIDELVNSGELDYKDASGWMQNESYVALVDGLGIPMQFENRGDVYNFNGFGYSRDYWSEKSDAGPIIKMAMAAAVSWAAGPALIGAFQGFGMSAAMAKAASSTIIKSALGYMQTGELDLEDALLSAALSYGGAELSDALQGSGVLGEVGSAVTDFGDNLMENGGDVLSAALQAGGMSLVTQMVKEGEIDWKDAAVAAAMAGGTALLTSYLSDIGKSDAEGEVLEEIKVIAQRKGVQVGDGLYRLEDGTVISDTGNVLGNISDLDLDGDGMLNANDLQDIDVNHDHVSTTPNPPQYTDYDGGGNAFREGGTYYVSEDGVVHQRGDVTYIDGGPNGTYLVKDAQGNEFYVRDATYTSEGRFVDDDGNYVAVNGYYDGASGNVYDNIEDYTSPNGINDNTANQTELTYGRNPNWNNDPNYRGTVYGGDGAFGVNGEMDVFYDPVTNTYYTSDTMGNKTQINVNELPENIQDKISDSASGADNNDNATGQDNASTDAGTAGGGATNDTGGNGASGPTGGDASTGGNQDSTGDLGGGASGGSGTDSGASAGGGAIGGGSSGLPDFSGMTPSEIAAWWAANGFGNPGGGMLGGDTGGNTQGTETGSGTDSSTGTNTGSTDTNSGTGQTPGGGTGDGSTGGDNTGGGDTSGSTDGGDTGAGTGGGGNSTDTEGGGGSGGDNSGTGDGNGDGSGSGTGTGGNGSNSGSGDSGSNSGAGDGTSGGAGSGGGTDGGSGGGSGGSSGGGTGGNSGGTGGGAGGGGEGGGGIGTGIGAGMLGGLGAGSGDNSNPQWGQLKPMKQFVARAKPQTNQQRRASLFADLLKGLG